MYLNFQNQFNVFLIMLMNKPTKFKNRNNKIIINYNQTNNIK